MKEQRRQIPPQKVREQTVQHSQPLCKENGHINVSSALTPREGTRVDAFNNLTERIAFFENNQAAHSVITSEGEVTFSVSESIIQKLKQTAADLYYELAQSGHTKEAADRIMRLRRSEAADRELSQLEKEQKDAVAEAGTIFEETAMTSKVLENLWDRPY